LSCAVSNFHLGEDALRTVYRERLGDGVEYHAKILRVKAKMNAQVLKII